MSSDFQSVFGRLKGILKKQAGGLSVQEDTADRYSLAAGVGPAALKAWGGKMKRPVMPVAWVEIGKSYVSFHLMGIYGNAKLRESLSRELKSRMQGKTCFNFKSVDEELFKELEGVSARAISDFRKAGYISEPG